MLELYVEWVGVSPMEAIRIGTLNVVKMMRKEETLEPWKLADTIGVGVNPLDDIKSLTEKENIKRGMKGGDVFKNLL